MIEILIVAFTTTLCRKIKVFRIFEPECYQIEISRFHCDAKLSFCSINLHNKLEKNLDLNDHLFITRD